MKLLIKTIIAAGLSFGAAQFSAACQPRSTIDPRKEQYTLNVPSDTQSSSEWSSYNITLSTSEVPNPPNDCYHAVGSPQYYWDFGMLDGQDNGDGTATIFADIDGECDVTVYCGQEFEDDNGDTDWEYTLPSDPPEDVQKPISDKQNGPGVAGTGSAGSRTASVLKYTYDVLDEVSKQAKKAAGLAVGEKLNGDTLVLIPYQVTTINGGNITIQSESKTLDYNPEVNFTAQSISTVDSKGQFTDEIGTNALALAKAAERKINILGGTVPNGSVVTIDVTTTNHMYFLTGPDGTVFNLSGTYNRDVQYTVTKGSDGTWSVTSGPTDKGK